MRWVSPLRDESFCEYRDLAALRKVECADRLRKPLRDFWPARGPVWDALGVTSNGSSIFVEAKAHIAEAASPGSKASVSSLETIADSLAKARRYYAPRASAEWTRTFYQYANRLAHHYFMTQLNHCSSKLVFLYFLNARDVGGPTSTTEWNGAIQLLHAALGLPADLKPFDVFEAFIDVDLLKTQPNKTLQQTPQTR